MLKQLWRKYGINPFDRLLKRSVKQDRKRFLICWNRGLGDIPLGLYALCTRIRMFIPDAQITFVTRADLAPGFALLKDVTVLEDPTWQRGKPFDLDATLQRHQTDRRAFDVVLDWPDPTRWLAWQIGKLTPKLSWNPAWNALCQKFNLTAGKEYIGVQVQTETNYNYEKNWPLSYWQELFKRIEEETEIGILLFGFGREPHFENRAVVDLRGQTDLIEMLSLIKNRCNYLLVPDSGVLSMTYYIDETFPIEVVSLWADPRQGVLKQQVASPNPELVHRPLIAKDKNLSTVPVDLVYNALFARRGVQC